MSSKTKKDIEIEYKRWPAWTTTGFVLRKGKVNICKKQNKYFHTKKLGRGRYVNISQKAKNSIDFGEEKSTYDKTMFQWQSGEAKPRRRIQRHLSLHWNRVKVELETLKWLWGMLSAIMFLPPTDVEKVNDDQKDLMKAKSLKESQVIWLFSTVWLSHWLHLFDFSPLWIVNQDNSAQFLYFCVCSKHGCNGDLEKPGKPTVLTYCTDICINICINISTYVPTRPVESKSLKVGKSLKIGKKSDKIGKIGIHYLLDFLDFLAIY